MMKYRKYAMKSRIIAVITGILLAGCAATQPVENRGPAAADDAANREPASMTGNYEWLNEVQDDFSRIADETSSRSLASGKPSVLIKHGRWTFNYLPANNQFSLKLDGASYGLIQTNLDDENMFSFSAEGQTETPITLTIALNDGRNVASAVSACEVELSFWDKKIKRYSKDVANISGSHCDKMLAQLRSYVP